MSGIAGIYAPGKKAQVVPMLERMGHRGMNIEVLETPTAVLGVTCTPYQSAALAHLQRLNMATDHVGDGHFATAEAGGVLKRDPLGLSPLYYGWTADQALCFASEVKGLLEVTRQVHELPPGHTFDGQHIRAYFQLEKKPPVADPPEVILKELRWRLKEAVKKCAAGGSMGSWLSGGLDSSALAALGRCYADPFHTFTAGFPGAPDVVNAQIVADHIGSQHHVHTVQVADMLAALPQVIYHLESFDAWLVRSSVMNYLVAQMAADYVPAVLSGEGGDELFAGYEYLKGLDPAALPDELVDITARLHNTALQRVDRSAAAHGTVAHVPLLDPRVVDYALQIPAEYKLHNGTEKWILRRAVSDLLPDSITNRRKAKFWEGAGVQDVLAQHAESQVSDADFARERQLPNGLLINTKEELMYYRIFREHFGDFEDLTWMGRTKGSPVA